MKINNRLSSIKEYHFKTLEDIKDNLSKEGKEVFDFGIGEPDLKTRKDIKDTIIKSLEYDGFNKYPPYEGIKELKREICKYYKNIYDVELDEDEVIILIGSKEGINNTFPAFCDFKDVALIPALGYPVYSTSSALWGIETYRFPLIRDNGYLPNINNIPKVVIKKAKLMVLNYPNNPTGAVATKDFYDEVHKFALDNDIVVCNDNAYGDIIKDNEGRISLLSSGKENVLEFGSFSKTFSMTGFRLGYAVGDKRCIERLLKIKSNVDSGQFLPIQYAGIEALSKLSHVLEELNIYNERRNILEKILDEKNVEYFKGKGSFYLWGKVPRGYSTDEFTKELLYNYGILVTPGYIFGYQGDGWFRVALTKNVNIIEKAFSRISEF
ncbi:aminotransferase class I/II-fold pyridoxal phosphate-dependent enzyme [Clostridium hydrogeniformans]|uniref:aminotransferase class I/II-fold pyridoxal phosphate-dependent enzyme n=1 Tax=Clostridium hydrogeniformans TaxID=349933 RepID=UPI000487C772|nr:aminotransferase class I/II-fold pyridoxal phosphate-dependent enzyme [Clostridium hydrogeniformans]